MMAHRAIQLGGWHWHKLLMIPVDRTNNMSVARMTEIAIERLEKHPERIEFIKSINLFLSDEIGQRSAEFDDVIDSICRIVRRLNVYKGNILEIATFDPTQLQPIKGKPFLISPNVIPSYKIVQINHSVRAQDETFYRIQQISRMNYKEFHLNPELLDEFERLCNNFTFVDSWTNSAITPSTFRIYSKQIPAKQASKDFIISVKAHIPVTERKEKKAIDLEKRRFSNQDWTQASSQIISHLEMKLKEPQLLLFFVEQFINAHSMKMEYSANHSLHYVMSYQNRLI